MKKITLLAFLLFVNLLGFSQIDKDQFALQVAKAEEQNFAKLKEYVWKRNSKIFIENQLKLTTVSEFKFNSEGKIEATLVDAKTTVDQKPGLRGAAQKNAAEDKMEYVQKVLGISMNYAFLSKGELVDFFEKGTITENDSSFVAVASNIMVKGDTLSLKIDKTSKLIIHREFTSMLGTDMFKGSMNYDKFSNGTLHGTVTNLLIPSQKMKIEGTNQDYTIRVK